MKTKYIRFVTVYNQKLVDKIIDILAHGAKHSDGPPDSYSMLDLSQALGKKYKEGSAGWENLRLHLIYMNKKGLIEERHFGKIAGDWNGKVDYV